MPGNSFSSKVEKYCRVGQTTDDKMAHSHCIWIPKATNLRSGCVLCIAFPRQQWLHKYTSVLRFTYIACLLDSSGVCNQIFITEYIYIYIYIYIYCIPWDKFYCGNYSNLNILYWLFETSRTTHFWPNFDEDKRDWPLSIFTYRTPLSKFRCCQVVSFRWH